MLFLQLAPHQQVEFLVGATKLNVGLQFNRVITLYQRVEKLVNRDRLAAVVAFAEVIAFQHARNRGAGRQFDHVDAAFATHPLGVENDPGLLAIQDFENLLLIGLGILMYLGLCQRRPGCALPGRISDHPGEVPDQEQHLMTEVLKLLELVDQDRVTEMQIRCGRIETGLDFQRTPLLQLRDELFFDEYFIGAATNNF